MTNLTKSATKTQKQIFKGFHQWTSYDKASAEYYKALEAGNKRIPDFMVINRKKIDWREAIRFCENPTKSGYVGLLDGVKIKFESDESPNYRQINGNGESTYWLTVISPVGCEIKFEERI
jgi:hypothetical protein